MSLYKRGETWWVNITHHGRRIRRSTGATKRAEAQRIHDEIKVGLWRDVAAGATLSDAFRLWLTQAERSRNEKNAIRMFLDLYPSRPLSEIDAASLAMALSNKGPAHANRILNTVRAALNLAAAHGMLASVPKISRRRPPAGRLRWLTRDEWQAVRAHLPAHLVPAAEFALATGLRQANVLKMRWKQIDLRRRVAWVEAADAKAGKPIGVPLSDAAIAALKSCLGQHREFVFTYEFKCLGKTQRRPISSPKTGWNRAIAASGIDPATWHDLRHTWASWHVMNGTPLAVLRVLGGWSSMEMVQRYAHLAPDHVQAWAENSAPPATVTKIVTDQRRV